MWYCGLALIEWPWGWSRVEEEALLLLRDNPETSASVSAGLGMRQQVVLMTHQMGAPIIQSLMDIDQLGAELIVSVQALCSLPYRRVMERAIQNA